MDVALTSLAAALTVMALAWVLSLAIRDTSVADIAWGPAFVAIAWTAAAVGEGATERALLLAVLVSIWGLRLALHIAARHEGEDRRYRAMRRKHGERFALRSGWSVFGAQALLAWVISLPLQVAASDPTPASLGLLAALGTLVFVAGLVIEAVADEQLRRFARRPGSSGEVMDGGLWRYSRHPNYFGEVVLWWGLWLVALETGSAWWTALGPALITVLLLRVSGVTLTERTIGSRRPGYGDYVRRTSAFVLRPPRG